MDNREEVREFLTSRRARLTPERAGLVTPRGHRRVAGLRRGEVADLAGMSVEYYARLAPVSVQRGPLARAAHPITSHSPRRTYGQPIDAEQRRAHPLDRIRGVPECARGDRGGRRDCPQRRLPARR